MLLALALIMPTLVVQAAGPGAPGQLVERVTARTDPTQSYALYLPPGYDASRRWPLLFVFDPRSRGTEAANLFKAGAERFGWIIASSNNTRSDGPWNTNQRAVNAMWPDVMSRLSIDPARVYAAGFSGGATVASILARHTNQLAGIIAVGAPDLGDESTPPAATAWFGAAGRHDFNYIHVTSIYRRLKDRNARRFETFAGAHAWMPGDEAARAIAWFEALAAGGAAARADDPSIDASLSTRIEEEEKARAGLIGGVLTALYEANPPPLPELRAALRLDALARQAAGTDARGDSARRSLELIRVQAAFYIAMDLDARQRGANAALARALGEEAGKILAARR